MGKWIALLGGLVVVAGCGSSGGSAASVPASAYTPTTHTVIYEADGSAESADYTLRSPDGGTQQGGFDLPMRDVTGRKGLVSTGFSSGDFVYLSVQNQGEIGSLTCRITVDGVVISENTSTGAYAIATCQGTV
jgi:Mycobacterium membrane protein